MALELLITMHYTSQLSESRVGNKNVECVHDYNLMLIQLLYNSVSNR